MREQAPIPDDVKSHPDYADGYYAAFNGKPVDIDRAGDSEPYSYGYEAGERAAALFEQHGFSRSRGGMSIRFSTPPPSGASS